jgi:hypothetical protein
MTHIVVSAGSSRALIQELQHYLALRVPDQRVADSGEFDVTTRSALAAFRQANWLPIERRRETAAPGFLRALLPMDDACDLTAWIALHQTETFNVRHDITLVHQRTDLTGCEMASLAMLLGHNVELERPVHEGEAAPWTMRSLPPGRGHSDEVGERWHDVFRRGAIGLDSGADSAHERLAERLGLRYLRHGAWTPSALATTLRQGPIMVASNWRDEDSGSSGSHAWVLAGMRGDGSEAGTACLRYDPQSVSVTSGIQSWTFDDMMAEFSTAFRQMIQGPARLRS